MPVDLLLSSRQRFWNLIIVVTMEFQACTKIDVRPLRALKAALWDRHDFSINAQDLLHLYEDRWRYIDLALMDENEKRQLETLITTVGKGVFLGR